MPFRYVLGGFSDFGIAAGIPALNQSEDELRIEGFEKFSQSAVFLVIIKI